jgi:hypothetical protein
MGAATTEKMISVMQQCISTGLLEMGCVRLWASIRWYRRIYFWVCRSLSAHAGEGAGKAHIVVRILDAMPIFKITRPPLFYESRREQNRTAFSPPSRFNVSERGKTK